MAFDFHTHHDRCGHATGSIRDYIEQAIAKGLQYIGISDHSPYFAAKEDQAKPGIAMAKSEFPHYIAEVLQLKKEYQSKIEVLLGVESDYFEEHEALYRDIYSQYPFDYIIGSVHYANGKSIFDKQRWEGLSKADCLREKELYYASIQRSARSGLFDILGHIDAMKGYYPQFSDIETEAVEQTLKIIADSDVAIEVNTSGKNKDCGGWYPSHDILERACFYNVKITFGSDAHVPNRVGDEWEQVRTELKHLGFKEWAIFKNRQRKFLPL
ncbi:histidinol-phosphatase (PHP family) [Pullulanibacillus pueri]|uniref:Histidinol-phosphatase n=1 Tax=Pullulanibacillus pueri TaxID=1437324 RepID=A0A8J3ENV1_9BACL|nr:histidinol-phosphatase [Pullulanibacillus pueri]MBM7683900.1 histidinol-phosphatase (PHP family) [Pullulanibacillus pueri]GGH87833.1 histidinol-phosphatase [Pullulanibacillus pueri]